MKKVTLILSIAMVLFVVSPAFGATLGYSPENVTLTVEPGSVTQVEFSLSIEGQDAGNSYRAVTLRSTQYLPGRLALTAPVIFSPGAAGSVKARLSISEYAVPGTYSIPIHAYVYGTPRAAKGDGLLLTVTVEEQCKDVPGLENMSIGPDNIKAKEGKSVAVTVSGSVVSRDGCKDKKTWFKMEDEYGTMNKEGNVTVDDNGEFSFELPVEASREGSDLDGRTYKITVFSSNETGTGNSGTFVVKIAHDQGTGKALGKNK